MTEPCGPFLVRAVSRIPVVVGKPVRRVVIDGVELALHDVALLTAQPDSSRNGPYVLKRQPRHWWQRRLVKLLRDYRPTSHPGWAHCRVVEGTVYAHGEWVATEDGWMQFAEKGEANDSRCRCSVGIIDVTKHGVRPENSGEENGRNLQRLMDEFPE